DGREGVEEVGQALAFLELPDEAHLRRAVAGWLHRYEALRLHRLTGDEDLVRLDAGLVDHEPFDVLAVVDDGTGGSVDLPGDQVRHPVKARDGVMPHPRPE